MKLADAINRFLKHLHAIQCASPHTLRNYRLDLEKFSRFLDGDDTLETIERSAIRGYLYFLNEQGLEKRTLARHIASLRSLFRHAQAQQWIGTNPMQQIENPKLGKKIPITLTYDQVDRLLSQPDTTTFFGLRDKAILEVFYSSGIRLSELVGLDGFDIDFSHLWMRIFGKGRKERLIPLTAQAASCVQKYWNHPKHPQENALFLNKYGNRLTPRSVDRIFKKYLHCSGLVGAITPHTIRHTIATHWLENNMNLKVIQEILGHSSPSTTTLYTQVSPQLRKETHEQFHPHG